MQDFFDGRGIVWVDVLEKLLHFDPFPIPFLTCKTPPSGDHVHKFGIQIHFPNGCPSRIKHFAHQRLRIISSLASLFDVLRLSLSDLRIGE
ncbi:MAG: hypothetical protein NWT08_07820 [Akkermansiaceae bacterium]|nr:hypothetical protein [Akkermansiaceae bacterium]MDP4846830.1 hypothetical protein [Akkermansiaceae bacterium]MDP4897351.1 hypothetical protein [Akkermansiaceae bacterium]